MGLILLVLLILYLLGRVWISADQMPYGHRAVFAAIFRKNTGYDCVRDVENHQEQTLLLGVVTKHGDKMIASIGDAFSSGSRRVFVEKPDGK